MRRSWSWLAALAMGFLIGPGSISTDPDDDEPIETEREFPKTSGRAVGGMDFYVWDEDARAAEEWALALAQAGEPARSARWRAIAARTAALPLASLTEHELAFATRVAESCESSELTPLGLLLCLLPSLDRTYLISSMATSPDAKIRVALARALAAPFEALGVGGTISHLKQDPNPEVARHARLAFATRVARLA